MSKRVVGRLLESYGRIIDCSATKWWETTYIACEAFVTMRVATQHTVVLQIYCVLGNDSPFLVRTSMVFACEFVANIICPQHQASPTALVGDQVETGKQL